MIPPLSEALAERGYVNLTPVQEAVIAPGLQGADLLVSAQTGSGKTVGFGLAIAPTLLGEATAFGPAAAPLALVVAPTRELAFQVMRELRWLYARTGAVVASCVGGMDIRQERRALESGAHIVVGTPGRLRDHIERGSLDLGALMAVVLDEADEMLDLGFREDLEFMLAAAPAERRTLMFSATVSPMIAKLAKQYQRDAQRVSTINSAEQHADIAYRALRVAAPDTDHAIFNLLRYHEDQGAIVFANTRAAVNHLTARLANRGLSVVTLSGELSQSERNHALQAMRDGRARVCVATDVAARGIDLPNLTLVIHADLPTNTESLLHRSGRTGRAGRKGISALIVPPKLVKKAERLLGWAKISAEWTVPPSAEDILRKDEERLMSDPGWDEPVSEEQAAFARRLLASRSPEAVAAAFLRLHQSRHAAPEELLPPDSAPARDKPAFGPSRWFTLSVGRAERAEARWILPLLRRAADLEKAAIGAIRVQDTETYVEIAEASARAFLAALGPEGEVADGVRARALEGAPDLSPGGRKPLTGAPARLRAPGAGHRKGQGEGTAPDRAPRPAGKFERPRPTYEAKGKTPARHDPAAAQGEDPAQAASAPWGGKAKKWAAPAGGAGKPGGVAAKGKPRSPRVEHEAAPDRQTDRQTDWQPAGKKPAGKKSADGKPVGKKPFASSKPGKPGFGKAKPGKKGFGKPRDGREPPRRGKP